MATELWVRRFSRTERAVHWIHATAFFALLGSGLVLYLPSLAAVGNRPLVKAVHIDVAIAWAVALALVVVLGDRPGLRRTARELDRLRPRRPALAARDPGRPGPLQRRPEAERRADGGLRVPVRGLGRAALGGRAEHALPPRGHDRPARRADVDLVDPALRASLPRGDLPADAALAARDHGRLGAARLGAQAPPEMGPGAARGARAAAHVDFDPWNRMPPRSASSAA